MQDSGLKGFLFFRHAISEPLSIMRQKEANGQYLKYENGKNRIKDLLYGPGTVCEMAKRFPIREYSQVDVTLEQSCERLDQEDVNHLGFFGNVFLGFTCLMS